MDKYDFVLIDCPPNVGVFAINALMASNGVIISVDMSYLGLLGVQGIELALTLVREQLDHLIAIAGVLATRMTAGTISVKRFWMSSRSILVQKCLRRWFLRRWKSEKHLLTVNLSLSTTLAMARGLHHETSFFSLGEMLGLDYNEFCTTEFWFLTPLFFFVSSKVFRLSVTSYFCLVCYIIISTFF